MLSMLDALKDIANRFGGISNWITKEYDKDGWHIIEYRNGWCCLYYERSITIPNTGWSAWGNVYFKTLTAISYPVTFATIPFQISEMKTTSASGWLNNMYNTISTTGKQDINRPAQGAEFSAKILYTVYGKLGGVIARLLKRGCYYV